MRDDGRTGRAGAPRGTVIFDLDGTLADTSADLVAAANACFRDLGHGDLLDPVADAATALHGGRAMLRLGFARLAALDAGAGDAAAVDATAGDHAAGEKVAVDLAAVDEAAVDDGYPRVLEAYGRAVCVHTRFYPGVERAVDALRSEGYRVGICTNKPEGLAVALIAALGASDLFDSLVGADTLPVRKPDPAPFREAVRRAGGEGAPACLVGDSETDHRTARAAGVPSILVGFGPEGAGLARLGPDALLPGFAALPALVADLLGASRSRGG